jgi:Ca-activated chloride channel family protein
MKFHAGLALLLASSALNAAPRRIPHSGAGDLIPQGDFREACPLKHTDVKADISSFIARVTVTQEFENPYPQKIEAVYTFPLPANSAVDAMTITVGDRVINGKIKRKEEARAIYDAARDAGYSAALLDQERPNIFVQSVANIRPGEKVKVQIQYVETLKYEDGGFEFGFPMVVGPRYIPAGTDGSHIVPPITARGTRAGHDVSLAVSLDAGLPIYSLRSGTHDIDTERQADSRYAIKLRNENEIPNKDFLLKYNVAGKGIEDTILAHHDSRGGFFTLILQPPQRAAAEDIAPRELVFVLDTSGSMSGFPIEKAKETMRLALADLNPRDTFNLITFSGDTRILFPKPVPATADNMRLAQSVLAGSYGNGGTEMMKAIKAALDPSDSQDHVRVVCFMTDGYVGDDLNIVAEVKRHPNARVFAFGIGSSVNHFLLDKMAQEGRGEVEYVGLKDDGSAAARRFYNRVRNPLLTDVSIDWGNLPVSEVYPRRIPDLFSATPVILSGRFDKDSHGTIRLRGKMAGRDFYREIPVTFSANEARHDVLASLWARRKVDDLMSQDWASAQTGKDHTSDIKEPVTQLGLDYHLMTQFTSFVAVEDRVVTEGGRPRRIEVPIEMPEGVSHNGVFGGTAAASVMPVVSAVSRSAGGFLPLTRSAPVQTVPGPMPQKTEPQPNPEKLTPALMNLIKSAGGQPGKKVEVMVLLNSSSEAVMRDLRRLGLEIITGPNSSNLLTGRIEVNGLAALSQSASVRTIAMK